MTKQSRPLALCLCALLMALCFRAPSALAEDQEAPLPEFSPLHFRVGVAGIYSEAGLETSYSAALNWNPEWNFAPHWNLGLNLGLIPFSQLANNPIAFQYQITLGRLISSDIWFELGAGAQSWSSGLNTDALITGTFYFRFPDVILGALDRAFVSYSACLVPNLYLSEITLGFGLSF
jgi:hypothetical protein